MEHSIAGLRRRSVPSNKKLFPPSPTYKTSTEEEIDPLQVVAPATPRRRRRSAGFEHFETSRISSIARFFYRELLLFFTFIYWTFKIIGLVLLVLFLVALFNALPLETRATTAKNFFKSVTDWTSLRSGESWWLHKIGEMVMGLAMFERPLAECLAGDLERCRVV